MENLLVTLINSHAAAYASGDHLLQQFAIEQLRAFFAEHEIIKKTISPSEVPE